MPSCCERRQYSRHYIRSVDYGSSDNFIEAFERHITLAGEAGNSTQKKDSIYNFAADAGDYLTLTLTVSGQASGYVPTYSQFRFTVEYRG